MATESYPPPDESGLVTKDYLRAELAELRADLRGEMAKLSGDLRGEMAQLRGDLRGEMGDMRVGIEGRLARVESEISWVKWIVTGGVGLYVLRSVLEWVR